MSIEKLSFKNTSAVSDVRIGGQTKLIKEDSEGRTVIEWQAVTPENCVSPAAIGTVMLSEKKRTVLETSAVDDVHLAIANTSFAHTLRLSRLIKKTAVTEPVGFAHPSRNGIASDAVVVPINSKTSLAIELLPK